MKALIVFAHPNHKSLNYKIFETVKNKLNDKYEIIFTVDLYDEKFDPSLIFNEEKKRREMHLDKETEKYRKMITEADHIYFIYPVWWNELPAILKGFIDKCFSTNFAYKFKGQLPIGLLKGKSVVIINSMDAPNWYVKLFLGDGHYKNFKNNILKFCGITKVDKFTFYGVKNKSKEQIEKEIIKMEKFLEKIKKV